MSLPVDVKHNYSLILRLDDTDEDISITGEFSEENWRLLESFLAEVDAVLNTKLVQEGFFGNSEMSWDKEKGLSFSQNLPDDDNLAVFLHKFRPLLLTNEKTYFPKIRNLIAKEFDQPYIRSMLSEQLDYFTGKRNNSLFKVSSQNVVLNSEETLFNWLNSYEFHRDKEKRDIIDELHRVMPLDYSKVLFLRLLQDKYIAVYNLAVFIRVLMGKQDDAMVHFHK